jgi:hypothetical protein
MPRSPLALSEQIKTIRAYLGSMSIDYAEGLTPSAWGTDGQLSAPGGKTRYHTGASFTDAVHAWLDRFPPHVLYGIQHAILLLEPQERRVVRSCLIEHQTKTALAALLGVSVRTLIRWEHAALDHLATLLWNDAAEPVWLGVAGSTPAGRQVVEHGADHDQQKQEVNQLAPDIKREPAAPH